MNRSTATRAFGRTNRRPGAEGGYSLVEVIASIVIVGVAIIPMVGMFDAGLRVAGAGADYDRARTLANLVMEQAKSLTYDEVRDGFPATSTTPGGSGPYADASWRSFTGPGREDFAGLEYRVDKRYLKRPPADPGSPVTDLTGSAGDEGLLEVTVTVRWGGDKTYGTTGVVVDGTS